MARAVSGTGRRPHKWRDRWRAYLTIGYDRDGKAVRRYVYGRTAQDCQAALNELIKARDEGGLTTDRPPTLSAWLEHWFKVKAKDVKPRTIKIYRQDSNHLPAKLLRTRLDKITPLQVQAALHAIDDEVSARASRAARKVLRASLGDAVVLSIIPRNPVAEVKGVTYKPAEPKVWSAAEVTAFITALREGNSWYLPVFYAALTTGARAGELFGMQWGDYDKGAIFIQRTSSGLGKARVVGLPKTAAARRLVPVSGDLAAILEQHRAGLVKLGLPVGPKATLFPTGAGTMLNYSGARRALHGWAAKAGIDPIRLHDLRHTYASMAIAQRVSPAELARLLGHSSPAFTMGTYVHFFEKLTPPPALSLDELTGSLGSDGGILGGNAAEGPS